METGRSSSSVTGCKKIAYAAPAFALAVVGIPIYVYLPKFYSDTLGVNVAVLGALLLAARIFDAITDPLIGFLSDRSHSRFGRRRPYIGLGSLFLALSIFLLFVPPHASARTETVWFAVGIFSVFLFWTIVVVPYESLGPEITFDYHERTQLFSLRDGLLIAGTLAAASSPALLKWLFALPKTPAGERATFFWMAIFYAPFVVIVCWFCVLAIREQPIPHRDSRSGVWQGLRHVGQNTPFLILLAAYTISAFGNNLPATLILYYVEYVLHSPYADVFLLLYFATGILFLPGWVALSRRVGKKSAFLVATGINTGAFIGVFFLEAGDAALYGVLVFLSGIGFGATVALPSAMQADVIDYDELLVGERREGQYIGLWSISKKLAAALGVGVALSLLGVAGYVPNVRQSPQVVLMLRSLYALVPSVCNLLAFLIVLWYPISEPAHAAIRKAIAARQAGKPVSDPLKNRE